ncbi:thioredoxin family protein [Pseudogracilibacillus sp. SE30717A]|uniref:thioredoxin family protein n=1 Tax=Pseudogracilibacillus sp. SE30717A TaxID=3098293 RepID=UPI00300DDAC9
MGFQELTKINDIEQLIQLNQLAFIYVTQPNCSVCHGLRPQIEKILKNYPKIKSCQVDASKVPEIAGKFMIFTAPVLLLFVNGKEYIREARFVQTELFIKKIEKIYKNIGTEI